MRLTIFSLLFLSWVTESVWASVLAIDYGGEWMKASLMKPGVPFDVLLNKDSKRKIQSVVGWKQGDRLFSSDAFNIAGRFPQDSFSNLKHLLAASYDSPAVPYYKSISTAELVETSRGTVALRRPDGTEWSVEELVAMQFAYVRELAEASAGEKVYDVIVTVPPYFTQFERDAIVDAIEIAGLRTLALINDGTAIAVNYAMTRTFTQPEYHVIYDAGASSIRATVVSFAGPPDTKKNKDTTTQINVMGVGWDRSIGGTELDRRLREIMIKDFQTKHRLDIRSDKRAMAKLWKEAGRVKAVLSANTDAMASVESLAYDTDYRSKLTRADFEIACRDLKGEYARPIYDALANAGLSLSNISSVILTGGASRTPMIQAAIRAAVGDSKIAQNVNADEAAVLGAAFHGASLSPQFKTKDTKLHDIGAHDIQIAYLSEAKNAQGKQKTINTLVLPAGSKTGSRKTLTFKRTDDFGVKLLYRVPPSSGFPTDILDVDIVGVKDAIQNLTESGAIDPVVKATVVLSESGFTSVHDAVAFGEIKDDSIAGKLKGLFGGGSSSSSEDADAAAETAVRGDEQAAFEVPSPSPSAIKTPKDTTVPLEVVVKYPSLAPMTLEEKRTARSRLVAVDNEEAGKRRREEARNSLEGYLYRLRDLLDDSPGTPFIKCSQEAERKRIAQKLEETFAWLSEYGDDAMTAEYLDKRAALEALERPVIHRYEEIEEFPKALNNSQMWNWSTRLFLTDAKENLTAAEEDGTPARYTWDELESLEKTLKEHESWLNEWVEKQKKVKMNEDPVILSSEMRARAKILENHLQRLMRKKAPRPPRKSTSTATTQERPTQTAESAQDTEESAPPHQDHHDEL